MTNIRSLLIKNIAMSHLRKCAGSHLPPPVFSLWFIYAASIFSLLLGHFSKKFFIFFINIINNH